jgi:hypothetical protein
MKRITENRLKRSTFLFDTTELAEGLPPSIDLTIYSDGCVALNVDNGNVFILYNGRWVLQDV